VILETVEVYSIVYWVQMITYIAYMNFNENRRTFFKENKASVQQRIFMSRK